MYTAHTTVVSDAFVLSHDPHVSRTCLCCYKLFLSTKVCKVLQVVFIAVDRRMSILNTFSCSILVFSSFHVLSLDPRSCKNVAFGIINN